MKILVYFLSLSILLLSCITCEDNVIPDRIKQVNTEILKIAKTQNVPHQDNCSPLCTCSCCGQPAVSQNPATTYQNVKPAYAKSITIGYQSRIITEYAKNIWQPPKLNHLLLG